MLAANFAGEPLQVIVPVYCAVSVMVVKGTASLTGAVTPEIAFMFITVGGADPVAGNSAVIVPESASLTTTDAPDTVKKLSETPSRV